MADSSLMPNEPQISKRASKRRRKPRPVDVWYRAARGGLFRDWCRFGKYADRETAERTVADQMRKHDFFEYSIGPKPQGD